MPRRINKQILEEPPRKKSLNDSLVPNVDLRAGEVLRDIFGKEWKLGQEIGIGGFGVIYHICEHSLENSNKNVKKSSNAFAAKIESHSNGPLFVEINCYLRIARHNLIEKWKHEKKLKHLGIPDYQASGSHISRGNKYRFLIIPRYEKDLDQILREKKRFNLKTVLSISRQIIDILEYIHSKGYIHSDIKASNIMLTTTKTSRRVTHSDSPGSNYSKSPKIDRRYPKLRTCKVRKMGTYSTRNKHHDLRKLHLINYFETSLNDTHDNFFEESEQVEVGIMNQKETRTTVKTNQIYLLDFGLATKYRLSNGLHKTNEDERKAHAGTLLFCSRDAHRGVQSCRSDLESLGYNMVYWLCGKLPWIKDIESPEMIEKKKRHCFADINGFLCFCFPDPPKVLHEFFEYVKKLNVQDSPDYDFCQSLLKRSLREHGYNDDSCFDFSNLEGYDIIRQTEKNKFKKENLGQECDLFQMRPPLISNVPIVPLLRKKIKTKKAAAALNWSKMLTNPEVLIRHARERKYAESNDSLQSVLDLDLNSLNPTDTMREIYSQCKERSGSSPKNYDNDGILEDAPDGYTPAMAKIWNKKRQELLLQEKVKEGRKPVKKIPRNDNTKKKLCAVEDAGTNKTKNVPTKRRIYSLRG